MSMDDNFDDADRDGVDRMFDDIEEAIENDPGFFDPDAEEEEANDD